MAFLGVERSLTGRTWIGPTAETTRIGEAISQETGLPSLVAHTLARLGVPPQDVNAYLQPALRDLLPDPRSLKDMQKGGERFCAAVLAKQKIALFADYDVDGGASAALIQTWLRHFGIQATIYVPDRLEEGYGPNEPAMAELAASHDLIICVDCGTLSFVPIKAARGAHVIILDHHLALEHLPQALAVINPNRQDETGDLGHLCAAAVVFLFLVEANRLLREQATPAPDLMSLLDLVALATVADVAPLVGVNRAFVRQGLKIMAQRNRPGLVALSDIANLDTAPTSYHLGFVLGPRINAGGRVGQANLGADLLACADPREAAALAERLDQLNRERRDIEEAVRDKAMEQVKERGQDGGLVWAADDNWHPGVLGIVASRLKERTNRPTVVIGFEDDIGKGSGRSVTGVDLGASIQKLEAEGLIERGGGHKMAAGLTLTRGQLHPAMERLEELLARQGADRLGPANLRLDGLLMPTAPNVETVTMLEQAGPFGSGAPAPRFAFSDQRILFAKPVGSGHLKFTFGDESGARIEAIAFGAMDSEIGPAVIDHGGKRFHLAGRLDINHWGGKSSVQLRLEDASPVA